jgi:exodeoxyribonuclease VII large subunit
LTQSQTPILSVTDLTAYVKRLMDRDELLSDVIVRGEISNLRKPASGHIYFSLKDDKTLLYAVCFRGHVSTLGFDPADGMSVVAGGSVTVYEPQGRYQIVVRFMRPDGVGALAAAFEQLKARLEQEGLFAPERKRPLPRFPHTIALVTSDSGAAVQDMISILTGRYPPARIKLVPTVVQGEDAAPSIVRSLRAANAVGADVIILGRGGGSLEDLWPFNEEVVAREVFASRVPVISAVGHETDYVLTDFVADVRAATPSHAAEMAVPDARELLVYASSLRSQSLRRLRAMVQQSTLRLQAAAGHPALRRPETLVEGKLQRLDDLRRVLDVNTRQYLGLRRARLETLQARLSALDPDAALRRGYSIVRRADDGRLITSVAAVAEADELRISVSDGEVAARVSGTVLDSA